MAAKSTTTEVGGCFISNHPPFSQFFGRRRLLRVGEAPPVYFEPEHQGVRYT
ncbi:MAG: hypothetical protein QGG36_31890 [Pirellulaceae bacterium]|jgi:hypothetical protein|nr:hypothetical protein [Pirellulaceae bacterium]MDP7020444.1 hypothetical protein [Pirellulaceae bacterium]